MSSVKSPVCMFVTFFVIISPLSLLAQESLDYENVVVTRWADPTTRPITYQEYVSSRSFAEKLNPQLVYRGLATQGEPMMIIMNVNLHFQIDSSFSAFVEDLEREG